jgi:hypothetical protein
MSKEIEAIKKDILESGFSLELETSRLLRSRGWRVQNSVYYMDWHEGRAREIDVIGTRGGQVFAADGSGDFVLLHYNLIIECKKDDGKPWVFFFLEEPEPRLKFEHGRYPSIAGLYRYSFLETKEKDIQHHYFTGRRKSRSHRVAFRDQTNTPIHQAIDATIKATVFRTDGDSHLKRPPQGGPPIWAVIWLCYPVVVFDGHLYECTIVDDEPDLKRVGYLQHLADHQSRKEMGALGFETFPIDVVQRDHLDQFLDMIEQEHAELMGEIADNFALVRKMAEQPTKA